MGALTTEDLAGAEQQAADGLHARLADLVAVQLQVHEVGKLGHRSGGRVYMIAKSHGKQRTGLSEWYPQQQKKSVYQDSLYLPGHSVGAGGGDLAGAQRQRAQVLQLLQRGGDVAGPRGADLAVVQV
jgi:hypothetical protein